MGDHTVALPAIHRYISIHSDRVFGVITRCEAESLQAVRDLYRMIGIENVYSYRNWVELAILLRQLISNQSLKKLKYLVTQRKFANRVRDYCFFKLMTLGSEVSVVIPLFKNTQDKESVYTNCSNAVFFGETDMPVSINSFPETRLSFSPKTKEQYRRLISEEGGNRLIVCCPGSNMPAKIWPTDRYAEVICNILKTYPNIRVVLIGSKSDIPVGSAIEAMVNGARLINLVGKTTIEDVAFIISLSHFYLGNDTGPMHIAAVLGKPILAIFSARDQIGKWYPPGANNIIKRQSVPCENCMLTHCNQADHPCMKLTSADSVISDLRIMLDNAFRSRH